MNIRPFTPDDWQSICDIHDLCKPDEMRGAVNPSVIPPIERDSRTQDIYRQSSISVVQKDGRVVGFIGTIGGYVSALCVHPEYRERGFGTGMMRSVMDSADGPVCLNVGKRNVTAIRLYERLGFTTDVEFVGKFSGQDVDVLRMRYAPPGQTGPSDPLDYIKSSQREWATRRGIRFDKDGYCQTVDTNVFGGLSPAARRDFEQGDGAELGVDGGRGKMQALHSSSALACNWFDFWRGRNLESLSRALTVTSTLAELVGLEQKLSTGVGGIGPNLDVSFRCADGTLVGVESKFTEPYSPSDSKAFLKPRYFATRSKSNLRLWADAGLPGCQRIAEDLRTGTHPFETLDASQLLKHMLALVRTGGPSVLYYVWYDCRGPVARQHRQEVREFAERLGDDGRHFRSLTYREVFFRMLPHVPDDASEYVTYVRERYNDWTS